MFILPQNWFPRRGFVQENSHLLMTGSRLSVWLAEVPLCAAAYRYLGRRSAWNISAASLSRLNKSRVYVSFSKYRTKIIMLIYFYYVLECLNFCIYLVLLKIELYLKMHKLCSITLSKPNSLEKVFDIFRELLLYYLMRITCELG